MLLSREFHSGIAADEKRTWYRVVTEDKKRGEELE